MRFLIDAQLPPLLCEFFVERGHDASHVFESFEHDAADAIIFERARTISAIVITKNEDFAARSDATEPGASPQTLWSRIGNCRNRALLATMARAWPDIQTALVRGERTSNCAETETIGAAIARSLPTTTVYYAAIDSAVPPKFTLGNVQTVTNAVGHVATFNKYDKNGRLLKMTDANSLVTIMTYHPRG